MGILKLLVVATLLVQSAILLASAYNVGDDVPLFVNKIGPFHNPSETYQYYELPFCSPDQVLEKKETLGEVLNGERLANTLYKLEFAQNKTRVLLCQKKLNRHDISKFRDAIKNDFYVQMYYDDLPLWAFIGKVEDQTWSADNKGPNYSLFKHIQFDVVYSGNQVIEIRAFSHPSYVVDVTEDDELDVEFTYSVLWSESATSNKNRLEKYLKGSSMPVIQKTHSFSFVNSIIIILLLMGVIAIFFMRHLKNDLRKWSAGDEEEDKEIGRKQIQGETFRSPANMPLFCAVMGCGTQLVTLVLILFILSFTGVLYPYNRGSLATSLVIVYTLTSSVAGFTSASFHTQFSEIGWKTSVYLAGVLFLCPLLCMAFILNLLAAFSGATSAIPFGTIFVIFLVYILIGIPSLGIGGFLGHYYKSESVVSHITKKMAREKSSLTWYGRKPSQMFIAGLLPFSAIVLELHHLYATIWGYKIFTTPMVLFVMFVFLVVLTAILNLGLTYFQLVMGDHEWLWRSVLCGGSTAIFMFAYSVYFYYRSNMRGLLQTSFFFGYTACLCYAFFLLLGSISFRASLRFVQRINHAVKSE